MGKNGGKKDRKKKKDKGHKDGAKPLARPAPVPPRSTRFDRDPKPRLKARALPAGAERFRSQPKEIAVFDPENVEKALDALPTAELIGRAADRLQGLAHKSRIQALVALSTSELCVGDVAAILGLSLSATSTMLKQLRALGYVTIRNAGKQVYYRVSSPLPRAVLDVLFRMDTSAAA